MDAESTLSSLRRRLDRSGHRLSPELRAECGQACRDLRRQGWSLEMLARHLGVSTQSVRRWSSAGSGSLVPVRVVAPVSARSEATSASLVLISPDGWRLEGLDLEGARALLGRP